MKEKAFIGIALIALAAVSLSGCMNQGTGTIILRITDAPASNYTHVNVTIAQVQVHLSAGGDNNSTVGWYTIVNESQTFDLISLKNVSQLFATANLTTGMYTQVRLYVTDCTVTDNGTTYNATVPSEKIKLIHPFTLKANATTTLTLDFDAEHSIVKEGNNNYKLKPVIQIIVS